MRFRRLSLSKAVSRESNYAGISWDLWGLLPICCPSREHRGRPRQRRRLRAAEQLGSSQFDYAQEEQKNRRDDGRDEQRAATAEPVGEEDEHRLRHRRGAYERDTARRLTGPGLGVAVPILGVGLA